MRNLTKALAAVSLLVPTSGHSLGIGDIKLHSALNQNLKAEIAVVVAGNENISASDIKVHVAPPEKLDEAGVPWSSFFSKIRFKPETKANGSLVITLTSNEALKEPFLDLLLEVSWPQGVIYREFTVLVDPPESYVLPKAAPAKKSPQIPTADKTVKKTEPAKSAVKPIAEVSKPTTPEVATKPTSNAAATISPVAETHPAPVKIDALGVDEPVKTAITVENKTKPAPPVAKIKATQVPAAVVKPKTQPAPVIAAAKDKPASDAGIDKDGSVKAVSASGQATKEYGPTKKKSNLFRIAKELAAEKNIPVKQMMYAIYEANPEAFYDDNMDSLRANQILKIPAEIAPTKEVVAETKTVTEPHFKRWHNTGEPSKRARAIATKTKVKAKKAAATKLRLRPPHENVITKSSEADPAATVVESKEDQESLHKLENANQDLQIKLKKMQDQLATVEKMLMLKNQQLAILEKTLKNKSSEAEKVKPAKSTKVDNAKVNADKLATEKVAADAKALEDKIKADKAAADKIAADKLVADKKAQDAKATSDKDAAAKIAAEKKTLEEKAKADKALADKIAADKAAADKVAADKKAQETKAAIDAAKTATEKKAIEDKAKADKALADKIAADKKALEAKLAADKLAAEKKAIEDKAKADKAAADKLAADKAIADKLAADKAAADKLAADKIKADKAAADKLAADKATADKLAADKAAADKLAADKAKADAASKAQATVVAPPQAPPPAINAQVVAKKPLVIEAEPAETEDDSMADLYTMVLAGAGVISFGVLGWLFWRKRKVESSAEVESMFTESSAINLPDDADEFSVAGLDDNSSFMFGGESSFLSDNNDFDAFEVDQDEVDPISEADVYLAYGRYQQAEELIRQAITDFPDRDECKFKLLEIFCVNGNAKGFEEYVRELADAGKRSKPSFWSKVVEMGHEIIPDSPLLTMQESAEAAPETTHDDDDFKPDLSIFDETDEETEASLKKVKTKAAALDTTTSNFQKPSAEERDEFDLSLFEEEPSRTIAEAARKTEQLSQDSSDELDLSMFDDISPTASPMTKAEQPSSVSDDDFDLSMFDQTETQTTTHVTTENSELPTVADDEFDLSMFDIINTQLPQTSIDTDSKNSEPLANDSEFDLSMFDKEPLLAAEPAVKEPEPLSNKGAFDLSMFDDELDTSTGTPASDTNESEPLANNVEFDLSMFDKEPPAPLVKEPEPPANNVEFDLSMFDDELNTETITPAAETDTQEPEALVNNVEFDLSMFDKEPPPPLAKEPEPPANNVEFDLAMFDDDLDTGTITPAAEMDTQEPESVENKVDFDLSMFDDELASTDSEQADKAQEEVIENHVDFDLPISNEPAQAVADSAIKPPALESEASASDDDEFDLSMFDEEAPQETLASNVETTKISTSDDDFDLSAFDVESAKNLTENIESEADIDLSSFDNKNVAKAHEDSDIGFDLSSFDSEKIDSLIGGNAESEEFDLSSFDSEQVESLVDASSKSISDFDLSEFDSEKTANLDNADEEIKFDLSLFDEEEHKAAGKDEPEIEFDLSAFDDEENSDHSGLNGFDFNLGDANGGLSEDTNFSEDLDNMDVLETKIDLARAFIDMGDLEAAKAMAEKVFREGTAEQKAVAQEILDSLP